MGTRGENKKISKKVLRPKKDDAPFQNLQKVPNPLSVSHYPIKNIHQDATRRNEIVENKKEKTKKKTQNFPEHNQRTNFFVLILLCVIARPTILSNPKAL